MSEPNDPQRPLPDRTLPDRLPLEPMASELSSEELLGHWYAAEGDLSVEEAEVALRGLFELGLPLLSPSAGFSVRVAGLIARELSPYEPSLAEHLLDWTRHTAKVVARFFESSLERPWFRFGLTSVLLFSSLFFAAAMAGVGVVSEADPDQVVVVSSRLGVFAVEAMASLLTVVDVLGAGLFGVVSTLATPRSLGIVTLLTFFSAMALFTAIRFSEAAGRSELS